MNEMNKWNDDSWIEFCTIKIIRLIIITSYTAGRERPRERNGGKCMEPKQQTHKYTLQCSNAIETIDEKGQL